MDPSEVVEKESLKEKKALPNHQKKNRQRPASDKNTEVAKDKNTDVDGKRIRLHTKPISLLGETTRKIKNRQFAALTQYQITLKEKT